MYLEKITVRRNGALGDVIMTLNAVCKLREKYNKITYVTSQPVIDNVGFLISNFVDEIKTESQLTEEDKENFVDFVGYNPPYPEKVTRSLIENFCEEVGVEINHKIPNIESLDNPFSNKGRQYKNITIHRRAEWSMYREYNKFNKVIEILKASNDNIKFYQIGGPNEDLLNNLDGSFLGQSFKNNLAAQSHSDLHLGIDSVFNHTSNLSWAHRDKTVSLILYLNSSKRLTGYEHNVNLSKNIDCRPCFRENPDKAYGSLAPKDPCPNPSGQSYEDPQHECGNIDPFSVASLVKQILQV